MAFGVVNWVWLALAAGAFLFLLASTVRFTVLLRAIGRPLPWGPWARLLLPVVLYALVIVVFTRFAQGKGRLLGGIITPLVATVLATASGCLVFYLRRMGTVSARGAWPVIGLIVMMWLIYATPWPLSGVPESAAIVGWLIYLLTLAHYFSSRN